MQCAWLFRAKKLARALQAKHFTLNCLMRDLHDSAICSTVPKKCGMFHGSCRSGIRFVVLEPLPQTRIDGVCFWLDDLSPVIALSFRYDRLDWFWFTLGHELRHVKMVMDEKA